MTSLIGHSRQLFRSIAKLTKWLRGRLGRHSGQSRTPASLITVEAAPSVEAAVEAAMNVQSAGPEQGFDVPSLVAGAWARVVSHAGFPAASAKVRADVLNRFAGSLLELYQVTSSRQHASAAISAIRVALSEEDPGRRSRTWSNLAFAYSARYLARHDEDDLREALTARRSALEEEVDPEQRPALYNNLAITLMEASKNHMMEVRLDEAIQALRTGTNSGTISPRLMAEMSNNLAGALVRRFDLTQSEADLRDATAALDAAIRHSPVDHHQRAMYLENARIGVQKLRSTIWRGSRVEGLDLALFLQNRLVEGSADSSDLGTLSQLLHQRYTVTGQVENLVKAKEAAERAITVADKGTREWAASLASRSGLLVEMFGLPDGSSLSDLNQAVEDLRQLLVVTGKGEPERAGYLNVLGVALTDRFEVTKDVADLMEASQAHIGAVDGSQEGDPLLPQFVANRDKFMARYRHHDSLAGSLRAPSLVELSDFVVNGILAENIAHERAAAGPSPTPTEVDIALSKMAEAAGEMDLHRAYLLSSLLLQQLGGPTTLDDTWAKVATIYLEHAASWLAIRPDETLLDSANEVRTTLINWAGQRETETAARALMAAALLDIDAVFGEWRGEDVQEYSATWNRPDFWESWLRPGAAVDREATEDTTRLGAVEAAEKSLKLLGRARQISDGNLRGTVLKQMARVELLAHDLGRQEDESIRHAYEALKYLGGDTSQCVDLWFLLIAKGERPHGIPAELLPRSWPGLLAEVGSSQVLTLVYRAARSLSMLGARAEVAEWLQIVRSHLFEFGSQLQRQQLWAFEGHYLDDDALECPEQGVDVNAAADGILEAGATSSFSSARISSALVHLAYHAHSSHQYAAGAGLIERAVKVDPGIGERLGPVYSYISATLWAADATFSANKGDLKRAAHGFAVACDTLLNLGLSDAAVEIAAGLCTCAQDPAVATTVASSLTGLAPKLLTKSAGAATFQLLENFRSVVPQVAAEDSALLLHQITKGLRFAIAMTAPGPVAVTPEQAAQLAIIQTLEAQMPQDLTATLAGVGVDDEMVLSSYIGSAEMASGRAPQLVAANLQRRYDNELAAHTLRSRQVVDHYLSLSEVQHLIGSSTVLLSAVLTGVDGGNEVQLLTVTREEAAIDVRIPAPGSIAVPITILLNDYTVQMHALGPLVAKVRREIRDDPLFRSVTRRGEQLLASSYEAFVPARLDGLRLAGKTHLCIWPQGPLHLLPFHLLGTAERLMADDWTVSVIPSLRSLTVQPSTAAGITMLSIGSADGGRAFGLAPEPSVEEQAAAVAAVFGAAPLLGAEATRERVLQAVPFVRYLHIAAHGSINEIAPVFQCIYLTRTSGNDGRLYAHDLLKIDLRGLDIVTLSTCESALGRFDFGDDVRGLPAALFLAGVKTIVGCLWPVHPDAAGFFFQTFYEQLLTLGNRLDAFRQAQVETRRRYPAHRDWGAFTLIGQWQEPGPTRPATE